MDWLLEHFQFVALVALALGSWAKRRMDTQRADAEQRLAREEMAADEEGLIPGYDRPRAPLPAARAQVVSQGPPPLKPPAIRVERTEGAVRPKRPQDAPPRPGQSLAAKATTTGGAAATRSRVSATQRQAQAVAPAKGGLLGSLASRKTIRRAVLLREILGPPVGLR